jgi:hypothetical protein
MDNPSADSLVTETTPFTQPNPDPAHALDPIKVGQKVSSPHVEHGAKSKRQRKPTKAAKAKKRDAADVAASAAAKAAKKAQEASASSNLAFLDSGKAEHQAALAHEVESFADLPTDAALMLRLADGDTFLDGTIRSILARSSPRPTATPTPRTSTWAPTGRRRVTEVWLVSLSGEAVRCAVGPIAAGGGYHAQIPAGHLKF